MKNINIFICFYLYILFVYPLSAYDKFHSISGDRVDVFINAKKSVIFVYESPYCSSCLQLLSNNYGLNFFNDSINKFIITKWTNSVSERRYSIISNNKRFPSFKSVFYQDSIFFKDSIFQTPFIILWDGSKIEIINYSTIFKEDLKGILFINKEVDDKLKSFNKID